MVIAPRGTDNDCTSGNDSDCNNHDGTDSDRSNGNDDDCPSGSDNDRTSGNGSDLPVMVMVIVLVFVQLCPTLKKNDNGNPHYPRGRCTYTLYCCLLQLYAVSCSGRRRRMERMGGE